MKKAAVVFSAAAVMALTAVSVPTPVEARGGWGWGPGIAGGLIAGALIGGLASNAYGYGPGYGYYGGPGPGYGYYGGYRPAYYGGYRPVYYRGYRPAYYGGYRYGGTDLPTTADMPRLTTVTDIEECTVRPMPTMAAPVNMAAGIVVGVTTGKTNTARSPAVFDLAASSLPDATSQPRYGLRAVAEFV